MDKQHAVISVNAENREYKLHDLGTLNGVSRIMVIFLLEAMIKGQYNL